MTTLDELSVVSAGAILLALALAASAGGAAGGLDAGPTVLPDADAAQQTIGSCTTIDTAGTYVLTSNITDGGGTAISETCIEIRADDVTLDGQGHTVDGRGVSHTVGVGISDAERVTVRNVTLTDWHAAVKVQGGAGTVRNVKASTNAFGVRLENATNVSVVENTLADNLIGVHVDAETATLENNSLSGNSIDVRRIGNETDLRAPSTTLFCASLPR